MYLDRTPAMPASSVRGTPAGPLRMRWTPQRRADGTTTLVARWTR